MNYEDRIKSLSKLNIAKYKMAYQIPIEESCLDFINRYVFTYDPRRSENKAVPFFLFPKQEDYIRWLFNLYKDRKNGMVDKCRDVGATWCFIAFSVWLLLFQKETSVGLFTYKADEVDKLGDISTLFGKARHIINKLPQEFRQGVTTNYFYIKNNENKSDIAGASGDNPGRGGRRSVIFKDESAFYTHAEMVEAALSEVSDCIIDISTHQGTNTLFYSKIISGKTPVFVFNWQDNPVHTQEWYDTKKAKAISEGMFHIFQREIERNPGASIENTVIPFEWMNDTLKSTIEIRGKRIAGLDVADEGSDTNALCIMDGNCLEYLNEWGGLDTTQTADKAFWQCVEMKVEELRYDNIGVGAGVKGEINRLIEEIKNIHESDRTENQKWALKIKVVGWSAAGAVIRPNEQDYSDKANWELFENAKSQAYWKIREEFRCTFRYVNNQQTDETKLLFLKNTGLLFTKFTNEICQPQFNLSASGKIVINKKPQGRKSPNLLEAFLIARAEIVGWMAWSTI